MKKIMSLEEFAGNVCLFVKDALPNELSEATVCTASLDIWDGNPRMVLLVTRPWDGVTTGFCLDRFYEEYSNGNATVESAAAAVINNRGLYNLSPVVDNSNLLQDIAVVIYG